ncbi:MAG TPA: TetR family transcriptional regulator, partial [Woeseiaceae bacterium]|nr:TetR family transcriptional regulator [Woeseiaceae bacterium]
MRPAPRQRVSRRANPTRKKILDAAERLFASRGFHGVSIRDITGAAGVDLALANYHFGSKKGLFEAVFLRRAEILNAERMAMLEIVLADANGRDLSVESVIDAFTHPLLNRSARGGPGWKAYFALVAQVNNSPELARVAMTKYYDPVVYK